MKSERTAADHAIAPARWKRRPELTLSAGIIAAGLLWLSPAHAQEQKSPPVPPVLQLASPQTPANAGPPIRLTLADALSRAQKNSPVFQAAATAARLARENHKQASAAMLPTFSYTMQYLNTQGNGISPVGRYVTNDGVHVYRAWLVMHQDMPASFFVGAGPRRAADLEAMAQAEQEIARRGLAVTVSDDYYAVLVAERKLKTAEENLKTGQHFLGVSEALEKGGEVAHADVIRFELQVSQLQRAVEDANLALEQTRLNLAVLLFPQFDQNFALVDDLDKAPSLPAFPDASRMAQNHNPEIRAAMEAYRAAGVDVSIAKAAFFPQLSLDVDEGIEANALAFHSDNLTRPGVRQSNLGYFAAYSLNLPLWDWGSLLSKLHQAQDQKELAQVNLSFAQRQVLSNLYSFYNEAATAWNQVSTLQRSVDLAAHNLQLITMQYEAGETQVLQVLDAETSLATARDDYATGEARYRTALVTLQTLTGSF